MASHGSEVAGHASGYAPRTFAASGGDSERRRLLTWTMSRVVARKRLPKKRPRGIAVRPRRRWTSLSGASSTCTASASRVSLALSARTEKRFGEESSHGEAEQQPYRGSRSAFARLHARAPAPAPSPGVIGAAASEWQHPDPDVSPGAGPAQDQLGSPMSVVAVTVRVRVASSAEVQRPARLLSFCGGGGTRRTRITLRWVIGTFAWRWGSYRRSGSIQSNGKGSLARLLRGWHPAGSLTRAGNRMKPALRA